VVVYFNSIFTADWFNSNWVDTYWSNISIDFKYKKCIDILKWLQKITSNWFFFVDADWTIKYKNSSWTLTNHRLKIENQIESMNIDEQVESMVNNAFVEYSTTTVWPYDDPTSIAEYLISESKLSNVSITNEATAEIYWLDYIDKNKGLKKQTTIIVNSRYDIESIKPGDTITILNTAYDLPVMLVNKVSYTFDKVVLNLDRYETFAETVLSNNDQ